MEPEQEEQNRPAASNILKNLSVGNAGDSKKTAAWII